MTAPCRRWFRFSLRTLFVVVTVLACWLGWQVNVVAQRRTAIRAAQPDAALFVFDDSSLPSATVAYFGNRPGIPLVRRWMGDSRVVFVAAYREQDVPEFERLFPEAEVRWMPFGFK
jgi:hypothetical protein